nr:reverse transcriptase domain-containing protein [Tanacetum cinerariifolium]
MTDSQSSEEGVGRVLLEFRVTRPQPWSVASFSSNNDHPSPTIISQIENTSRTVDIKPNKRLDSKKELRKQNHSANREGKHKSINGKRSEQGEQVRLGTIIGMIRGNTSKKRPRKQSEQWFDNEISFPSTPGCQLVDSPIILEALIKGFLKPFTNAEGWNKRNDRPWKEGSPPPEYQYLIQRERPARTGKKVKGRQKNKGNLRTPYNHHPTHQRKTLKQIKKLREMMNTLKGRSKANLRRRFKLIEILRKHADAFAWTPADMTGIPCVIAELELKTYPHIKPRVQRKWSIALDRRKVVKEEVAEWLKAEIVRKVKEKQEKDKIGSKPDKNRKRVEAEKILKQLQCVEEEKLSKKQKEWQKTQTQSKAIQGFTPWILESSVVEIEEENVGVCSGGKLCTVLLHSNLKCDRGAPCISKPNFVDESSNIFNPPPQPPVYSCEFYGSNAQYGHYCTPQAQFNNPEQGYSQDFNFPHVEDLVPIPSEFEGIPDTMCNVHFVNNPTPLKAKDHVEIVINSNDDISSSDDDSLHEEIIEYVEASPHDSELVSLEAAKIVIPEVEEIKDDNPK